MPSLASSSVDLMGGSVLRFYIADLSDHCSVISLQTLEGGRHGKTILKSGQEWTLPAQLGQLKTGQRGKGLLQIHLWCPDGQSPSKVMG